MKNGAIYWLCGSPCAGKTTIALALAQRFSWTVYHCDDYFAQHREQSNPIVHPTFYRISRLEDDALWLRDIDEMVASEPLFFADQFKMVIKDLEKIRSQTPILFEGSSALPHLLKPLLTSHYQALWLIPTESFQRHYYAQRPWIHQYLNRTSHPVQAFENWMRRDTCFASWLKNQVIIHDVSWLSVDGTRSLDESIALVANHFQAG